MCAGMSIGTDDGRDNRAAVVKVAPRCDRAGCAMGRFGPNRPKGSHGGTEMRPWRRRGGRRRSVRAKLAVGATASGKDFAILAYMPEATFSTKGDT